ncbi:hypothetical protein GIB67_007780 [Kingdonia uniflora]|uniref:Mitochondrial glycoprotein n=1 Tax=Kingdonia uniflora TaxID=39325 RepID=A0A7J7N1R8_9MAGN|nr:hypothetical protein GIB67_007780 [Kingdonia uniflora]
MAFSSIIRRATPLAIQVLKTQRNYTSAIFNPLKNTITATTTTTYSRKTFLPTTLHFSSLPQKSLEDDKDLLVVIDEEIKCAIESNEHDRKEEIPEGFPFEIQDKARETIILLKRKFQGEDISVEVYMPPLVTGEDDKDDDNSENSTQMSIPLVISVSKDSGQRLEFGVTAFPDEIQIESLTVKEANAPEDEITYDGPDFLDLDENLQKAFHKYLEVRGIKPSTTNFLHGYMINKDGREYLMWLKNLKKFIGE